MIYLLTYDGYMKEEKIQEICPSAKLFMQCAYTRAGRRNRASSHLEVGRI